MFTQEKIELKVTKNIPDFPGLVDIAYKPRGWSKEELDRAMANIVFPDSGLDFLESSCLQFLLQDFFLRQYLSGFYIAQSDLWSALAKTKTVLLRHGAPKIFNRGEYSYSDMKLKDSTDRFLQIRLVKPDSQKPEAAFADFSSKLKNEQCQGAIFFSPKPYSDKFLEQIKKKTKAEDEIEKYSAKYEGRVCLNLFSYKLVDATEEEKEEGIDEKFQFSLDYPLLVKPSAA